VSILVNIALVFATRAHAEAGQTRAYTGEPYIVHPIDVMMVLKRLGIRDETVLAAALLHDVVEDTPTTIEDVAAHCGLDVARLVDQVTNKPGETFTDRLVRLGAADWQAQAIKCADIASNCRELPRLDPVRATTYLPKKKREVNVLSRAPCALWALADNMTNLPA
jgi:guanosine-3',5'-bis(diphosphate) 3'-pyrophosphohydrolase